MKYISQLQTKVTDTARKLSLRDQEVEKFQRELAVERERVGKLESSLATANTTIEDINKQNFEASFKAKEELNRSTRKSSDLKRKLREATEDMDTLKAQLTSAQQREEELRNATSAFENEIKHIRAQQLVELKAKDMEKEAVLKELAASNQRGVVLQNEVNGFKSRVDELQANLDRARVDHESRVAEEIEKSRQAKAKLTSDLQVGFDCVCPVVGVWWPPKLVCVRLINFFVPMLPWLR